MHDRRAARRDRRRVIVVEAPDAFVAGEESAVIRWMEGGPGLPRDRTVIAAISGVRGPSHIGQQRGNARARGARARHGPQWFRGIGDPVEPGTMLVTLSGATAPQVVEVPTGTPLSDLLGTRAGELRAALVGGYHGTWIPVSAIENGARLSRAGLTSLGGSPGAGVVHALSASECGLARTADIVAYLADAGPRQCGPCLNGLPRLAQLLGEIAYGRVDDGLLHDTHRMIDQVEGRGSCRHPDGTARLIRSALDVFADDLASHRRRPLPRTGHRHCRAPTQHCRGPMMSASTSGSRLHIDWTRCDGRGLCTELLPHLLARDDWGYPLPREASREPRIPPSTLSAARSAVAVSPTGAVADRRHSGRRAPAQWAGAPRQVIRSFDRHSASNTSIRSTHCRPSTVFPPMSC